MRLQRVIRERSEWSSASLEHDLRKAISAKIFAPLQHAEGKMTIVKIEIDSEPGTVKGGGGVHGAAHLVAEKVGLLASITPAQDLIDAFELGLGQAISDKEVGQGYKKNGLVDGKNKLKGKSVKVFATVGGNVSLTAMIGQSPTSTPPFVSLVGSIPAVLPTQCRGGVSLESYATNAQRKAYLKGLAGGTTYTDANIFLLTNPNSGMHADEVAAWANADTAKNSYVGLGGNNDATHFAWDFAGDGDGHPSQFPPAGTTSAVIVSDDPFFQANREALITAANTWLGLDATRRIVYPSQIYQSVLLSNGTTLRPKATQSILIGPDLLRAYELLGMLASVLARQPDLYFEFFSVVPILTTVVTD
jgi:hypothetical protein